MKKILIIIIAIWTACSPVRQSTDTPTAPKVEIPNEVNSCITNKQYRMRLKFVKDSMRIEAKKQKQEVKYIYKTKRDSVYLDKYIYRIDSRLLQDSLKAYKQMYRDSIKASVPINKQNQKTARTQERKQEKTKQDSIKQASKTDRTELRQSGKTKRRKWCMWLLIGFAGGVLVSNVRFRR